MAVYSLNSDPVFEKTARADLAEEETKAVLSLAGVLKQAKGIQFVLLKLKDGSGHEISRNTYWFDPHNDFRPLMEMPRAGVNVKLLKKDTGTVQNSWTIQVTNSTNKVAFFVRFQLLQGKEEITPSLWSSNYITLAPGESIPVEVKIPSRYNQLNPVIQVSGCNVNATLLSTVK